MSASPRRAAGGLLTRLVPPLGYVAHFAGLALLGVMLLAATAYMYVRLPWMRPAARRRFARRVAASTFDAYLRALRAMGLVDADTAALDALQREHALVIVPNHPSLLDAVMVISRLPNASCIMKAGLSSNLFLGPGARALGYIRNDSLRSMIRRSIEDLRVGGHLLIFPEGTRTIEPPIDRLRGAFALIAKQAQVPIQLVIIETESGFLGKGWPLWRKPAFPVRYRVRLGPRVQPQGSVEEIVATVRAQFEHELGRPPLPAAAPAPHAAGARQIAQTRA
ncbi:MAG TPA: lysophospholipid acyltransferase family protein [Burkholderiaceae bacterium]|nr:lysophospholipid acyltransferase family protein [Burkholderiaceae bacterium]